MPAETPGAVPARRRCGSGSERGPDPVLAQRGVASPALAPLHPGKAAQTASLQIAQLFGRLTEPEIASPARQIDRQPVDGLLQTHASRAPRQRSHPAGKPGQRLRRNPTPRLGFAGDAEAEEFARLGARYRRSWRC